MSQQVGNGSFRLQINRLLEHVTLKGSSMLDSGFQDSSRL